MCRREVRVWLQSGIPFSFSDWQQRTRFAIESAAIVRSARLTVPRWLADTHDIDKILTIAPDAGDLGNNQLCQGIGTPQCGQSAAHEWEFWGGKERCGEVTRLE